MSSEWIEFDSCIAEVIQSGSPDTEILGRFWNEVGTDEADEAMWQKLVAGGFEIIETGQAEALARKTFAPSAVRDGIQAFRDFAEFNALNLASVEAPVGDVVLVLAYLRPQKENAL